jgi:DNA phosphorothioation-dependent restriction protein DptG
MSITYLALLRGVNVGGKNKLPMKELAEMFAEMGYGSVRTYIQSGNVIFKAACKVLRNSLR